MALSQHRLSTLLIGAAACGIAGESKAVAELGNYAIFGNNGVTVGQSSTVFSGGVGSNGPVTVGTFSKFYRGLAGGGDLNSPTNTAGSMFIYGPTTFNGNVNYGSFNTLYGPVNSGGDALFGSSLVTNYDVTASGSVSASFSSINGNVKAGKDLGLTTSFDTVTGNVSGNGNVNIQGTINGNVAYGGNLTTGAFTHITGASSHATTPVSPIAYIPQVVPAADSFSSGGANVTNGGSLAVPLAPGSYGSLALPTFANLYLGPGNYYFSNLNFGTATKLHLVNLTAGSKIHIFSTGDVTGHLFFPDVNGVAFASADPALSANVLLETLGNFNVADDFYGSIFAPNGSITTGNYATIDGSLIAGNTVNAGTGTIVNYFAPSDTQYVVPEPGAIALAALAVPLLARRRKAGMI